MRRDEHIARHGARGRPASRKKKALKWASLSMAAVLLLVVSVAAYLYLHFNGNLQSTALLPDGVTQAAEIPDKFGQTPMNILLLGNAGRIDAADCKLAGACKDTAATADTLMVVHLAADRSNMTVMSIPRDSIVNLPACAHDAQDLINASLASGPACAVQAVHDVTGLTIDHFIEIDMSGVVTMSNALGGVPVCVTNNLYDSYSLLKLPKGTSTIKGVQALAWLRTRHAFINEVYREQAQHMFMAALLRKLKDNASLSHVTTLYSVADAATKALTVDSSLNSVLDLLSLAQEIGKVPTSRATFLSVPTVDYAGLIPNWKDQLQFDQPAAQTLFSALASDTPYTRTAPADALAPASPSSSTSSLSPPAAPSAASNMLADVTVNKAAVPARIENGSGVTGRAAAIKTALEADGFTASLLTIGNAAPTAATALYYPPNRADSAAVVATALAIPPSAMHQDADYSEVTVVIGKDWTTGTHYASSADSASTTPTPTSSPGLTPSPTPTGVASSPPASSLLTNGANDKACMYVPQPQW